MSPATKTRRKKGDPREVKRTESDVARISLALDRIRVQWGCTSRSFTVDDLREVIELIDLGAKKDMWLHLEDSSSQKFWITVKDGKMYPGTSMTTNEDSVSWALFKRALQATITELLSTTNQEGSETVSP